MRRALPHPLSRPARTYVARLDERLRILASLAQGTPLARTEMARLKAGASRGRLLLQPFETRWNDGDENLVRGFLDRWVRPDEDPAVAAARGLTEAALALGGMQARPEALFFFLWEMESILSGLADPGQCDE